MPSATTPGDLEDTGRRDGGQAPVDGYRERELTRGPEVVRRRGAEQHSGCQGLGEGREGLLKTGIQFQQHKE